MVALMDMILDAVVVTVIGEMVALMVKLWR